MDLNPCPPVFPYMHLASAACQAYYMYFHSYLLQLLLTNCILEVISSVLS